MAFNLGSGLGGGLSGAASGAALGSVIPGLGTAIGGGVGGLLGLLGGGLAGGSGGGGRNPSGKGSFLGGNPAQTQQLPRYTPQQQSALNQLLSRGLSGLNNTQEGFQPIANQARRQFQTNTIPGLAERFTAMGGGQRSSAFQGALGSAGSELESALASLGSQYGLQQQDALLRMLGLGTQPSFENIYIPRTPGFGESVSSGLGQAAGSALPVGIQALLQYLQSRPAL